MNKNIFSQSKMINDFLNNKTAELEKKIETPHYQKMIEDFLDKKSQEYEMMSLSKEDYEKFLLKDMIEITSDIVTFEFTKEKTRFYEQITSGHQTVVASISNESFINLYIRKILDKIDKQYDVKNHNKDYEKIKKQLINKTKEKFFNILKENIVIEQKIIQTENKKYVLLYNNKILVPLSEAVVKYFKEDAYYIQTIKNLISGSRLWNDRKPEDTDEETDQMILSSIVQFSQKEIIKFYFEEKKTLELNKSLYFKLLKEKKIKLYTDYQQYLSNQNFSYEKSQEFIENNNLNTNAIEVFNKKINQLLRL